MRSHSIVKRFVNSMSKITERTHVKKEDEAEVNSVIKAIVKELAISIRDAGVEDTFGKEISTKAELRKATEEAAKDAVLAAFDDIDLQYADSLVKNYLDNKGGISYINRVSGLTESRRRKKVKESRFRFRKSRLKEWNDYNDPPESYWGRDRDSIDSAIDSVIKIYNVDGLLGDGDNVSSAYEAALEGEEDVAITRAEIISELKWDIAHEASKFVDDEDEIDPSEVSDEEVAPLVAKIIKKLEKAGVLVESRFHSRRNRIVESEDEALDKFRKKLIDTMAGEIHDTAFNGFDGSPYSRAVNKSGEKGFISEFNKIWRKKAKELASKYNHVSSSDAEKEYDECLKIALDQNGFDTLEDCYKQTVFKMDYIKGKRGVEESRLHEERTDEYENELHNFRNDYVYEIGLDIDEILSQGFDNTPYASDIDKFGEDGFLDKFEERWTREAREMAAQYEPPILGDDAVEEYEVCLEVALKNNGVDSLEQVFSIGIGKSKNVTESRTKTINESSMAGLIRIVNRHRF